MSNIAIKAENPLLKALSRYQHSIIYKHTEARYTALLDSAVIGSRTFTAPITLHETRNWAADGEKREQARHSNFANKVLPT